MSFALIIGYFVIAILSFILLYKDTKKQNNPLSFLLFLAFLATVYPGFTEESSSIVFGVLAVVSLNLAIGSVKSITQKWIKISALTVSWLLLLILFNDQVIEYNGEKSLFQNKFLIIGVILALFGYELAVAKIKILQRFFGKMNQVDFINALLFLFLAAGLFLGDFSIGTTGVLVIGAAFLSSSFYRRDRSGRMLVPFYVWIAISVISNSDTFLYSTIASGDIAAGLFLGVFSYYFMWKLWKLKKNRLIGVLVGYLLVFGLNLGLLLLGDVYNRMGGMDAFIASLVGFSIATVLLGEIRLSGSLLSVFIVIGALFQPVLKLENTDQINSIDAKEVVSEQPLDLIPIQGVSGKYTINPESSKILFELGKSGETKGTFKKMNGQIEFAENLQNSSCTIELSLDNFSTFDSYRDESLMTDLYFNQAKYPGMTYVAKKMIIDKDGSLIFDGQFTMLGVSKSIKVAMNRIKTESGIQLLATGKIDRTEFGMNPSASEGNIVSFKAFCELIP